MKPKKPAGIFILVIFLFFSALISFHKYFYTSSIDLQLLSNFDLSTLYFTFNTIFLALELYLAFSLLKYRHMGYRIFFWVVGIKIFYTIFMAIICLLNREELMNIYTVIRKDRGLALDSVVVVTSPGTIILIALLSIFMYLLFSCYIYKKRGYFVN